MRGDNLVALEVDSGAVFSDCKQYRYELLRRWMPGPLCMFLMLNPSTADEFKNDPTVERCERYARSWGYSGLLVGNLFAYRATKRADMKNHESPIGEDNDKHLIEMARRSDIVVCAWGVDGSHLNRSKHVIKMLNDNGITPYCLTITKSGEPGHPLYLKKTLTPCLL